MPTPGDKAEAILQGRGSANELLATSLNHNWRGITKQVDVCGGSACIAGTRIPVWVLVNARNIEISESALLYDYPTLTATDLANAWVYADVYTVEIADEIRFSVGEATPTNQED